MAKKTRNTKPASDSLTPTTMNMAASATPSAEDAALSDLLAIVTAGGEPTVGSDEVVEPRPEPIVEGDVAETISAAEPDAPEVVHTDSDIAAAVAGAESVEAMIAAATPVIADGTVTGDASDLPPATDEAPAAKPKKAATPRKHYTDKTDRIIDRLGDSLPEHAVLTLDDASLAVDEEALKATVDVTIELIRGFSQKKKKNRAGFLLEFVAGKKAKLNAVMKTAFEVLLRDGKITKGKDGNYIAELLKTYTPASARAMGENSLAVLEDLQVFMRDESGALIANDESLLFHKVTELLATADMPEGDDTGAGEEVAESAGEAPAAETPVDAEVGELAAA